jgi:hypothetical protein
MAKKKKVTQGAGGNIFNFGTAGSVDYLKVLKAFGVVVVLVFVGVGFVLLERYIYQNPKLIPKAKQINVEKPEWASQELMNKIRDAAAAGGAEDFVIDENLARRIALNLADNAWISNVRVAIQGDTINVSGTWRKPIASFRGGTKEVFVATDCMVLEYVDGLNLPIIELKGVPDKQAPAPGQVWNRDDVAAAIKLLVLLDNMDQRVSASRPLLVHEITGIDVANFGCRKSSSLPQIVLFVKDGTNINWGAPVGQAQRYIEAPEKEKLASLYAEYKKYNTLTGVVKYIELRFPQTSVPSPNM